MKLDTMTGSVRASTETIKTSERGIATGRGLILIENIQDLARLMETMKREIDKASIQGDAVEVVLGQRPVPSLAKTKRTACVVIMTPSNAQS